ncbi:6-phosphogluconolactonase [soil metagenome]
MVKVFKDPNELLTALADFIVAKAKEIVKREGRFNFVLSGGSSPKKLYELLASDSYKTRIDWKNVFFFFGDERYVAHTSPDSNFFMVKKALFDPLKIKPDHIFGVDTSLPLKDAALDYEKKIKKHLEGQYRFDLVLLGLGDNSHTASLFPRTSVLHEKKALVKEIYVEEVKMDRITFTAKLINRADTVVFLVYGAGKAEAIHHILKDPKNIEEYPAQLIHPDQGDIQWFIDEPAARLIQ